MGDAGLRGVAPCGPVLHDHELSIIRRSPGPCSHADSLQPRTSRKSRNAGASSHVPNTGPASKGGPVTNQIAIVAQIRPGMKPALERTVGDADVVFVFTGPAATSQLHRMASMPALLPNIVKMTGILTAPRLLQQTFRWEREPAVEPAGHPVSA
jgi:hypothetical protein